jgi:hypothetical protein
MVRLAVLFVAAAAGCAQTTHVKVETAHTDVLLDGVDIGPVEGDGVDVDVKPGMKPVKYEIRDHDVVKVGSIARTDAVWWMLALGIGGAACCAPTLASAGFCVANPGVIGAPIACLASGDVATLTSSFVAPSWFTLPLVAGCGALGLSPLALALISDQVPKSIVLIPNAPAEPGEPGVRF